MSHVIDFMHKLEADKFASLWIDYEKEACGGDERKLRLAVWRGLLVCNQFGAPWFGETKQRSGSAR
jgi:hypothetical protein